MVMQARRGGGGQDPLVQNLQMRSLLLAASPHFRKKVGSFSVTADQSSLRMKLFNVGIITRLVAKLRLRVDGGTSSAATKTEWGPWNLLKKIKVQDFDGTDRVNISGPLLWSILSWKYKTPYGVRNEFSTFPGAARGSTNYPVYDAPVNTDADQDVIDMFIEIPLAVDHRKDLRGAILAQTGLGDLFLIMDFAQVLNTGGQDEDKPYHTAGTNLAFDSITVDLWQDFYMPQVINGVTLLPQIDLLTVQELSQVTTSDNIVASGEKLIPFPNVRTVVAAVFRYLDADLAVHNKVDKHRIIANGNNIVMDDDNESRLFAQREIWNDDLVDGLYFYDFSSKPIETAVWGNVQYGATMASTIGASDNSFDVGFVSLYTKGSTLPGLPQSST